MSDTVNDPIDASTLLAALQHALATGQQLPVLQHLGKSSEETNPEDRIREAIRVLSSGEQPAILSNLQLAGQITNQNLRQWMTVENHQEMLQAVMATMAKAVLQLTGDYPER